MSRFPDRAAAALIAVLAAGPGAAPALAEGFGLGRVATPDEVAAWDIDVRPDGQGLPPGAGDVLTGEALFIEQCAACHGDFGEGVGRWPVLAGGHDSLTLDRPVKTIGSYWPYLSTVYDYVNRAMPFGYAQSLAPDEVYAITAYLLYVNDVVLDEDFVLSHENFTQVRLPNEAAFVEDVRPDTPTLADAAPCMTACKPSVEITMRAVILDVTPDSTEGTDSGLAVE
ncbi:MAG: cytochrome c [Pseudomonadota bacterium]